jgi:heme exporter protein A
MRRILAVKLCAENLTCTRGERTIFSDLSFVVTAGEALLVTGRNGAGKSSLLAIVAGLLRPEAGHVRLEGRGDAPPGESITLVGHREGLKGALTAEENLRFARAVLGNGVGSPREALETFGLGHVARLPVAYLSAGQRRRVALARLVVSDRPIWLLDEPTSALDAASQDILAAVMAAHLGRGGLIVVATHGLLPLKARELRLGP